MPDLQAREALFEKMGNRSQENSCTALVHCKKADSRPGDTEEKCDHHRCADRQCIQHQPAQLGCEHTAEREHCGGNCLALGNVTVADDDAGIVYQSGGEQGVGKGLEDASCIQNACSVRKRVNQQLQQCTSESMLMMQ